MQIEANTIQFLKRLKKNNNKEWFTNNKADYQRARANMKLFMLALEKRMNELDVIENHSLSRINRDLRFSKDKTPYKDYFWGYLRRFGHNRRGGYALSIEIGKPSLVSAGFYSPNKEDLYRIRKELEMDSSQMRAIINDKKFKETFSELIGEGVKTAPRGFDKKDANIDLIRKKQFYVQQPFSEKEILQVDFLDRVVDCYQTIRPFFDYMTEVLTTNINGEPVL